MGFEGRADGVAEAVVVVEGLDLADLAEGVEGVVVQVVDLVDVRVGDDGVGELLHVPDPVGDSGLVLDGCWVRGMVQLALWEALSVHSWPS